jgi:phytoene desaturase
MAERRRAVVVGAGLAGLATAVRLARQGWAVTVCEQGERPGGKMNLWAPGGYRFDTGPSLVTMPWVFRETFAAAGERLEDWLELVPVTPHAEHRFADGTRLVLGSEMPSIVEQIRQLEPRDVAGLFRFLALGARLWELSAASFLAGPLFAKPDAALWKALRRAPLTSGWGNYHRTVAGCFRSPQLVQLFDRYPTYVGSSPYAAPATLAVIPYLELVFGAWTVRGGLYRIVESLVAVAERLGVTIETGARVERIEVEGRQARGVVLADGRRLPAEAVVVNADSADLPRFLGRPSAEPLPVARRSLSGFVLLWALRQALPGIAHHTVCFSADYAREFGDLFGRRQFPEDPTVYVSAPSRSDRGLVPDGEGEALFVMANAPADGQAEGGAWTPAQVAEARRRVCTRLEQGGFPVPAAEEMVHESVWTPDRFARDYRMPGGAIYGEVSHGWRGAFVRPTNQHAEVRNLFRVGGSAHPGGGTPTVLLSAKIACERVAKELG